MLQPLIQNIPNWQALTNNEILSVLNSPSEEIENSELQSYAGVQLVLGIEKTAKLKLTLERTLAALGQMPQSSETDRQIAFLNMLHWGLSNTKVNFADRDVRSAFEAFRPVLESIDIPVDRLLSIGIQRVSPYVKAGGVGLVTIEQVNVAVCSLKLEAWKQQRKQKGATEYNDFIDAVDRYDGNGPEPDIAAFNVG
jgi:hypothetical protein